MPKIDFRAASRANYTVAHRPSSAIRLIVIHVTESSALGAITWFQNPKADASANYVVSKTGAITEMVPDSDIAWQAGNWAINRESIGIEHEGYTYRPGSFTDAEYRASAQLVASEMRHYLLPIDRKHIIGHSEVPDPNHAGEFGGFAHHTDPGKYWNWTRYLAYVTSYARGDTPAPELTRPAAAAAAAEAKPAARPQITAKVSKAGKVKVVSSGLANGQTVSGFVPWRASVANAQVARVDFLIDGRLRATEKQAPFAFGGAAGGWDTTRETNGVHVLTLRVVAKNGSTAGQSLRVTVANTNFSVASAGIGNGQTLSGKVRWQAVPAGAPADHVDFLVDGKVVGTQTTAPYLLGGSGGTWDSAGVANGLHTLALRAVAADGRIAESSVAVVVSNAGATPPKSRPTTPGANTISIVEQVVPGGGTVSGRVAWQGVVSGGTPARVEFWIDGRWRWTETQAPYVFNGDGGTWNTAQESTGPHVLTVKALRADGLVLDAQTTTVVVQSRVSALASPAPTALSVVSSIPDGSTLHGAVAWTATVGGATPDRVEFSVDGQLRHTERSAPYDFGTWDTTQERNGPHTLTVRAVAPDGTVAQAIETVLVSNVAALPAIASQSLANGQTVSGSVGWTVVSGGSTPDRVEFWVDGTLRDTATSAPYSFSWETTRETNGAHALVAKAISGAQVAQAPLTVTVANAAPVPPVVAPPVAAPPVVAPPVTAPLAIASQTLTDGQTVSGKVSWQAVTSGATPDRVEFWVDGTLRWTDRRAPFVYGGDGASWDTTRDADGTHALVVKAFAGTQVAQASLSVVVQNHAAAAPPPTAAAPAIVSQSIASGQTLSGRVTWSVTTSGSVSRVEFLLGSSRIWVAGSAPWTAGGAGATLDTRQLRNGPYTLTVRAIGADGSSVTASVSVTVSN